MQTPRGCRWKVKDCRETVNPQWGRPARLPSWEGSLPPLKRALVPPCCVPGLLGPRPPEQKTSPLLSPTRCPQKAQSEHLQEGRGPGSLGKEVWGPGCPGLPPSLPCPPPHPLPLTLSWELLQWVLQPGGASPPRAPPSRSGPEAILALPGSRALRRQPLRMCRSARHCTPSKKEL